MIRSDSRISVTMIRHIILGVPTLLVVMKGPLGLATLGSGSSLGKTLT